MTIRAKMQVTKVATTAYGRNPTTQAEITLTPQYDQTIPEDRRFQKATPSGSIIMFVDNPAAVQELALGKFFYVDFSEVPAALAEAV